MKKLNELLAEGNKKVLGFPAFEALTADEKESAITVYISTLPAAQMLERGITDYYTPVIPRGSRFETAEQILEADLDVNLMHVDYAAEILPTDPVVVVTQHQATVDVLSDIYSNINAVITGNASADDVRGKNVVGVLPPFLISECARFKAYSIDRYNATKDGDLDAVQTAERLVVNKTISVTMGGK